MKSCIEIHKHEQISSCTDEWRSCGLEISEQMILISNNKHSTQMNKGPKDTSHSPELKFQPGNHIII